MLSVLKSLGEKKNKLPSYSDVNIAIFTFALCYILFLFNIRAARIRSLWIMNEPPFAEAALAGEIVAFIKDHSGGSRALSGAPILP